MDFSSPLMPGNSPAVIKYLALKECRRRVLIGIVRGDMYEAIHVVLCYGFSNALCALYVHVFVVKVPDEECEHLTRICTTQALSLGRLPYLVG